jgi:hypothetical protein
VGPTGQPRRACGMLARGAPAAPRNTAS